jgi:4-hydroxy-2-oxoglutarate aldolase
VRFEGIFAALTTPFAPDGSLALGKLRENIGAYNRTRLSGYVVAGSTGESVLLAFDEIVRIWETARESAAPGKLLIAGAGVETTAETILRARKAAELDYDAVLIKTPHYFKPVLTPAALERHYLSVADASPLPVLIYSIPQYTGLSLAAEVVAHLAEHPNIVGIKESSGNVQLVAEIVHLCPPEFSTLVGSASTLFPSLMLPVAGGVLALACFLPQAAVEIYEAARAGDTARASRLQFAIFTASRKIAGELGPVGVKYAMDCVGYYGGNPRLPLLPLTDAQKKTVESVLAESIARQRVESLGVAR